MQSSPTTYSSALRLLEITSTVIHDLASNLYQHFHPHSEFYDTGSFFGRIGHASYIYAAAYRNSEMSVAGYWAETVIFGGPVLFARGSKEDRVSTSAFKPTYIRSSTQSTKRIIHEQHVTKANPSPSVRCSIHSPTKRRHLRAYRSTSQGLSRPRPRCRT